MASEQREGTITIVKADFIDDVAKHLKGRKPEVAIQELEERYRTYKMAEQQLLQKKARLLSKLPEIQKTRDAVHILLEREGGGEALLTDFELADNVYAKARLVGVKTVNLWLGAGVMVEYTLAEARELLDTNLANCKANLATFNSNLETLKDYTTITEVSMARVYNYDVEARRAEAGKA